MIDPTPYGIQWEHHWQILTHFYSYSHIRDYYDSDRVLTPPHRWNALLITPTVPTMIAGASYPFTLTIQNTGSYSWTAGDYAIGYEWRDATGAVLAAGSPVSLTAEVLPGAPLTLTLPVTAPVVTTRGTYTLAWDLRGADGAWFQAQEPPWFPQDVAVAVQPRCAYTLPLTPTLGTGEYPDVAYDGGRVEYLVVWGADDAVRGRIVRSTGEATNISFTLPASLYLDYGWGVRAAYTPAAARYVLVWRDARTAYHHLHGQVIASGGQVAADFALPSAPNRHQGQPAIACSTTVSECVVVWQEGLETLYARPLRFIATAAITWGAKITIAQHGAPAYAALAYYTPSQHYVVIWKTRTRLEWYLYSISGLGLQVDDTEIITHTLNIPTLVAHASVRPAVSCGAANCLIVWRDEAERLGGQLVWDDDTLANTATVPIAATGRYPTLVYHQSGDKYWLAWESNGAIYGQELHRDGGRWCLNTLLARTPGINLEWVRAAAGDTADEYLVVWQEAGEIRGTLYRGPSCCEQVCLPAIFKGYGYD